MKRSIRVNHLFPLLLCTISTAMAASFLNIGMHTLQSSKTSLAGAGNDVDDFIKLSAYSEKINELSLKLSVQTDAHSQLKGTLSQLQNEIDAIQLMIFSNDRKLSAAETNLYTSTNSLSYYEALYVELTESNKILIPQLPALKSKVDTLAAALKTALADADDAISKKNNSIASLDNSIIKRDKDYDAVAYSNFFSSAWWDYPGHTTKTIRSNITKAKNKDIEDRATLKQEVEALDIKKTTLTNDYKANASVVEYNDLLDQIKNNTDGIAMCEKQIKSNTEIKTSSTELVTQLPTVIAQDKTILLNLLENYASTEYKSNVINNEINDLKKQYQEATLHYSSIYVNLSNK